MSRLARKNRTDIILLSKGGITDLCDNLMKEIYRINDEEYDFICEHATDEELSLLIEEKINFSIKRQKIIVLNRIMERIK